MNPKLKWTAIVAGLLALTQFNTGLKLFYSKWSADEVAQAAVQKATEAKSTADDVDERFERYLERQDAVAEALNAYVGQQQAPRRNVWEVRRGKTTYCCTDTWDDRGKPSEECWKRPPEGCE